MCTGSVQYHVGNVDLDQLDRGGLRDALERRIAKCVVSIPRTSNA